jgi:16S rRNA (uracil1498-N3)-methyltransferase
MRERRFLLPNLPAHGDVEIAGSEAHHLLHVLRLKPGDRIVIFDGRGTELQAELTRCGDDTASARLLAPTESRESPLDLTIAIAVPKMQSMSRIVQKLTELGVQRIVPVITERTTVTVHGAARQITRWRRIAAEACKQSGRSHVPPVGDPLLFHELLELSLPTTRFLFTLGGPPLREYERASSCVAAVGPEGGWSEGEIAAAVAKGFRPVGLGPRTLRTETAALAVAAILGWLWGDPPSPV